MAPSKSDLPSAADHSERLSRMNMLLSKHSSTLAALKRSKPSTSAPATVSKLNDSKKSKSSFSALKNSSASNSVATPDAPKPQQHGAEVGNDDDDSNFSSVNAGIGFVPASKEIAHDERSAATRDLRGKLLGKRAREQKEDAAAMRRKKKGRVEDDESDEDEGRSKIGKGRKKTRKTKVKGDE